MNSQSNKLGLVILALIFTFGFVSLCVLMTPPPRQSAANLEESLYDQQAQAILNRINGGFLEMYNGGNVTVESLISGAKKVRSAYTSFYTLNPPPSRSMLHADLMTTLRPCDRAAGIVVLYEYGIDSRALNNVNSLLLACNDNISRFNSLP